MSDSVIDKELQDIIDKAFIDETCPIKKMHSDWRKELLTERIISYLQKQLSNQFNAKPAEY